MPRKDKAILIVEDDADLAGMTVKALSEAGYKAVAANSAREASFKLKSQSFDCILVDLQLGQDTGEHVIQICRNPRVSLNAKAAILVISGKIEKECLERIRPLISGALVKPFGVDALVQQIDKLVLD
jgi:DNA-binding response OmpR family regulator